VVEKKILPREINVANGFMEQRQFPFGQWEIWRQGVCLVEVGYCAIILTLFDVAVPGGIGVAAVEVSARHWAMYAASVIRFA